MSADISITVHLGTDIRGPLASGKPHDTITVTGRTNGGNPRFDAQEVEVELRPVPPVDAETVGKAARAAKAAFMPHLHVSPVATAVPDAVWTLVVQAVAAELSVSVSSASGADTDTVTEWACVDIPHDPNTGRSVHVLGTRERAERLARADQGVSKVWRREVSRTRWVEVTEDGTENSGG